MIAAGRARRRANAEPAGADEIDTRLRQCRHLRQHVQSLRTADGNDFELPVPIVRDQSQWRRRIEVNAPGDDLLHGLRAAAKWHLIHRDAGDLLQLSRQNLLG